MKNSWILVAKIISALVFLFFIFMAFVAFNPKSASFILSSTMGGGFFYEKSIHVFEGLLALIIYQICTSFAILFFGGKLKPSSWSFVLKIFAILSLAICLLVYFYSAVFPWSIPTVD